MHLHTYLLSQACMLLIPLLRAVPVSPNNLQIDPPCRSYPVYLDLKSEHIAAAPIAGNAATSDLD